MTLDRLRAAITDLADESVSLASAKTLDAIRAEANAELAKIEAVIAAARTWEAARLRWDVAREQCLEGDFCEDADCLSDDYEVAGDTIVSALAALDGNDATEAGS